jgi:hypothetical protein
MRFGDIFERFLHKAPISVMFRALLERALDPNVTAGEKTALPEWHSVKRKPKITKGLRLELPNEF